MCDTYRWHSLSSTLDGPHESAKNGRFWSFSTGMAAMQGSRRQQMASFIDMCRRIGRWGEKVTCACRAACGPQSGVAWFCQEYLLLQKKCRMAQDVLFPLLLWVSSSNEGMVKVTLTRLTQILSMECKIKRYSGKYSSHGCEGDSMSLCALLIICGSCCKDETADTGSGLTVHVQNGWPKHTAITYFCLIYKF